jgi:dienelactone hydrolase
LKTALKIGITAITLALVIAVKLVSRESLPTVRSLRPGLFGEMFYSGNDRDYPAVIILHGSGGLTQDYREYASRFVQEGYAVLLIDFYAETGSADAGSEKRFGLWDTWQKTLKNGVDYLKELPNIDKNRIGIIGFSRGAWLALTTISSIPDVKALVDYYGVGRQPLDSIANVPPILMLYGGMDSYADSSFVVSTFNLLKHKNENVELIRYPNAGHGFNFYRDKKDNDLAAADAHRKTLLFLEKYLKTDNKIVH